MHRLMVILRRLLVSGTVAALLAALPGALAQETRGSIQGRILDSSAAVGAGASVAATNAATNVSTKTTSNQEGAYSLLFLPPGVYNLSVSMAGFKTIRRDNIQLPIHERLQIDFTLELGDVSEQVQVTAEMPLLQTANANLGVVVESRRISELPTAHGSAFSLMYLSAGTLAGRTQQETPVAVTSDTDFLVINGAPIGTTDFTIDGVPNTQTSNTNNGSAVSNSPPADVVEEFKLETAFDASVGHTSGTVMNVSLKTGANAPHGTAYVFDREPELNANSFFANRAGQAKGDFSYKRWGATLSGPVYIPKLYSGRDRTFFSYGYEGLDQTTGTSFTGTVPDPKNTGGDFSNLLALGADYQIYDPATIQATGSGRYSIQPLAGNVVPSSRISPIAKSLLALYPQPNQAGQAGGINNFYRDTPSPENYYNHIARIDHVISDRQRIYGRVAYVHRLTGPYRQYWEGPATGNTYYGKAPQIAIDDVYTLNPTTVLNVRLGYTRYGAGHTPLAYGVNASQFGFPSQAQSILGEVADMIPVVNISAMTSLATETGDYVNSETRSLFASVSKQHGNHNIRIGADIRRYLENVASYGYAGGSFTFDTRYTKGPLDNSSASPSGVGQGLAAFLLGQPTSGYISRNANQATVSSYWAFYFHDNWRVSRRLTLDLGLRWEHEGPTTERYNRAVRGFDANAPQAIEAAARAAYAAKPDSILPADQYRVRGGMMFAGVGGQPRSLWDRTWRDFAPRIGFSYQALQRTVVRGGFGIYPIQLGVANRNRPIQSGFSQATSMVTTLDSGQTFLANLANPYPSGITQPTGASLGAATFLGYGVSFYDTRGRTPYDMHWSLNTQTMLPSQILLEIGYHGSKAAGLGASRDLNAMPNAYLSTSPVRDQARIDYLTQTVANPLAGLIPGTTMTGATTTRPMLLMAYPQFSSVSYKDPQGYNWYHALQVRAERRFSHGFTMQVGYGFAKSMEALTRLNSGDPLPYRTLSTYDRPHQFELSSIVELPFGQGRRLFSGIGRLANGFIGGWQTGIIWTYVSGMMFDWGNVLFLGNSDDILLSPGQRTVDRWFNTGAGFERTSSKQLGYNLRSFPLRFSSLRAGANNVWNLSLMKKTKVYERCEIQFRAEAFNAFNHAIFDAPNASPTSTAFGRVTTTASPRQIQLGLKLAF